MEADIRTALIAGCAYAVAATGLAVLQGDEGTAPATAWANGEGPGAPRVSDVSYTVRWDREAAAEGALGVSMSFDVDAAGPVVLSLPAWTPGSYELDHFARFVTGFEATSGGAALDWDKTDWDSWRVRAEGPGRVTVSFAFRGDTLDTGMTWLAEDFAYFNGTNVFLFPEDLGYDFPARVRIETEPGWKVATGLRPASGGGWAENSYHDLVDMPTFVGAFDVDSAAIDGVTWRLATYPPGVLAGDERAEVWEHLEKMMPPMAAVFGDTPWESYTVLAVFPEGFQGASALEHQNSHLGIYLPQIIGNPIFSLVLAHEIFHAWNVKRLRPADLWPYDYDRPQPTPLLWMSEGITDYYADLALVRGGIIDPPRFYGHTENKIGTVEAVPPVALEDASLSTWIEPVDGTAYVYYQKGSLAGLMLDILIRDATANRGSLDQVMRRLYDSAWRQGRGFTTAEWWETASEVAGGMDFSEFARRYVDGRDPYPWDEILPKAGLRLTVDSTRVARIGISSDVEDGRIVVASVSPGSSAAAAGIEPGDVLLRVGEVDVTGPVFGALFRDRYGDAEEGAPLAYVVERDGEELTLEGALGFDWQVRGAIEEIPDAPPAAVAVREGILTGRTGG